MGKYLKWVHGSDVSIEWPDRIHDGGSNSAPGNPRPVGWGTIVRQETGDNWFHFAIPTPTAINSKAFEASPVVIEDVFLHATVNESARVDRVHVWDGDNKIWGRDNIEGLENEEIFEELDISDDPVREGVGISVHVDFSTGGEIGKVTFHSAGAQFDDDILPVGDFDFILPF